MEIKLCLFGFGRFTVRCDYIIKSVLKGWLNPLSYAVVGGRKLHVNVRRMLIVPDLIVFYLLKI